MYVLLHFLIAFSDCNLKYRHDFQSSQCFDKRELTVHFREKKTKSFLQYFPYAEPTSIYHSKVYNYMQNNVKKIFIRFRMWTLMLLSHKVYEGVWFYHQLSVMCS